MSGAKASKRPLRKRPWIRKLRNGIAGSLGPLLIRVWTWTLRMRWLGFHHTENGVPFGPRPGIYVFWHQRLLMVGGFYRGSGGYVLISEHGDGEMIARVVEGLGMRAVRGSSRRGGARATLEILRAGGARGNIGITPDGPRGPKHVFQEGAVYLASRTGLPLYPCTIAFRRATSLPSWDGFLLPWPFTAAIGRLGEPLDVPPDADRAVLETFRQKAERRLRELTDSTDQEFEALYAMAERKVPSVPVPVPMAVPESETDPST